MANVESGGATQSTTGIDGRCGLGGATLDDWCQDI